MELWATLPVSPPARVHYSQLITRLQAPAMAETLTAHQADPPLLPTPSFFSEALKNSRITSQIPDKTLSSWKDSLSLPRVTSGETEAHTSVVT